MRFYLLKVLYPWIIELPIYSSLDYKILRSFENLGTLTRLCWSQAALQKDDKMSYMSKKVCSLASKLWSVICSQNSRSWALVMEGDVIPLRRANASNNSLANSLDSCIPNHNHTKFHQFLSYTNSLTLNSCLN